MAKSLASFAPTPTFKGKAEIPVAGKGPQDLLMTYRFHNAKDMKVLAAEIDDLQAKYKATPESPLTEDQEAAMHDDQAKLIQKIAAGWEFSDEFSIENIKLVFENHVFAFSAIVTGFFQAHSGAKTKN